MVGLAVAAAVAGLILGDPWLWVAAEWSSPAFARFSTGEGGFSTTTTVALILAALVKAALIWLILRTPMRGPLDRREKALRLLLYLAVAYDLVLWIPIDLLPGPAEAALPFALWTAIYVLFLLVIRWRSRVLRAAAGAMCTVELAAMANDLLDELDLLEFGSGPVYATGLTLITAAATALTVAGQRRDGRWSFGTQTAGWAAAGVYALWIPVDLLPQEIYSTQLLMPILMDALGFVATVWIAATARELPTRSESRQAELSAGRRRVIRVAAAAVVMVPIIAAIPPHETPRLTYTGWSMDCYDRPAFGDLKPAERDGAFLCRARSRESGVPPMFPDTLPDQAVLAYGRELCRAKDREEQEALLTRAGSERAAWGADSWDLVYVCPEIIGRTDPSLLRSTAQAKAAESAFLAEKNAACRDPWPRTKGVVQATANYFLFADGDPGYLVHDPKDETNEEGTEEAMDQIYEDDSLIGGSGSSMLVGHVEDVIDLCLTVKAFRTAPPRRTAGWDQVHEVPILSRTGGLTVPEMGEGGDVGAGAPMPNLAIAGKGHYRLRVYVRLSDGGEEHLVVVFPGRSKQRLKLKT
ncbi:hypothetical protein [Spongiactinospora sp. TRM90649]|uniref:hypothetical protein n=1 Tax=Spongiactinospora sp. TRM90649 TaxID=3031114 RepID=UPI0023F9E555|nr:hypothetical protein [Spongiactinospora sp. TRM90649]MDF5753568.1 hypothetical protein [Spongiactinospora sp. TRM90649]